MNYQKKKKGGARELAGHLKDDEVQYMLIRISAKKDGNYSFLIF